MAGIVRVVCKDAILNSAIVSAHSLPAHSFTQRNGLGKPVTTTPTHLLKVKAHKFSYPLVKS